MTSIFPIHVSSLDQVRELDVSTYDGIITIEDTTINEPFRVQGDEPKELILWFDDILIRLKRYNILYKFLN